MEKIKVRAAIHYIHIAPTAINQKQVNLFLPIFLHRFLLFTFIYKLSYDGKKNSFVVVCLHFLCFVVLYSLAYRLFMFSGCILYLD